MKKLLCILAMLLFAIPALAEMNPFAPYTLAVPESAELEETESAWAFVSGTTRVVAMVIERVPDEDPAEAVARLMSQFEPDAAHEDELTLADGYAGLTSCNNGKYGENVDQWNVMILSPEGDLLILSGYDLQGDEDSVLTLIDEILAALTVDGAPILIK